MPKKASKVLPKKKAANVVKTPTKQTKKEVDTPKKGVPTKESAKQKSQPDRRRKTTNGIRKSTLTRSTTRKRAFKPTERFMDYIIQKERQPIKEVLDQKDRSAVSNMLDAASIKTIKSHQLKELSTQTQESSRLQESEQKNIRSQRKAAVKASKLSYNPTARGTRPQVSKQKGKSQEKVKKMLPVSLENQDIYFEDDDDHEPQSKKPKILRYKDIVERVKSPGHKSPASKKR